VIREDLLPDVESPTVQSVVASPRGDEVVVIFSEPVDIESAEDVGNYVIRPRVRIYAAALDRETYRVVRLRVRKFPREQTYTLHASGVLDRELNAIAGSPARSFRVVKCPEPIVELRFDEGAGRQATNTGRSAASHPIATLTPGRPTWSAIVPTRLTGEAALDFGAVAGLYAVELGEGIPEGLHGARSLTITGWLNSRFRNGSTTPNCVVSTLGPAREGFELEVSPQGALRLGIHESPSASAARSSDERIPARLQALQENWRFFAVTYDASKTENHVAFYTGTRSEPATLDSEVTYGRGSISFHSDSKVTVGHVGRKFRMLSTAPRGFHGLVDEIAIYSSSTDSTGALSQSQIRLVQQYEADASGGRIDD
jgi:hypothetical protein